MSVSVDRFSAGSRFYLLTHLHSDHTPGLHSQWAHGRLLVSRPTSQLLQWRWPALAHDTVPFWSWVRLTRSLRVACVPVDAHCWGACWWLVDHRGRITLHMGDYRFLAWSSFARHPFWESVPSLTYGSLDTTVQQAIPSWHQNWRDLEELVARRPRAVILHTAGLDLWLAHYCRRYHRRWYLDFHTKHKPEMHVVLQAVAPEWEAATPEEADVIGVARGAQGRDVVLPSYQWFALHPHSPHSLWCGYAHRLCVSLHASPRENQRILAWLASRWG